MIRTPVVRVLLVAVTLAIYWQVTNFGFVDYDDPEYVRDARYVRAGLSTDGIKWAFTTNHDDNWFPLTWLSLMLDAEIYRGDGLNAGGYHLTNLLLHAINVLLLFEVLRRMTAAVWRPAFVAGLLASHPIHVESVAWITERKDVLSMLFWLLTMLAYVGYVRRGGIRRYVLTALCLAMGLMSKPMAVTLPFVLLLLDYWPLRRMEAGFGTRSSWIKVRHLVLEKVPLFVILIASSIITLFVQHPPPRPAGLDDGVWIPLGARLCNAVVSYLRYIGKLFWPTDLAVLYPNPSFVGQPFWDGWQVAGSGLILAAITAVAIALHRRRPYFIVGWLWFIGTMIPVIGIVQIGRHSMANRYAYIPFIGLYIIAAWSAADVTVRWRSRTAPLGVATAIVLSACAALTYDQTGKWRHSVTLFEHTLAVTEDNWLIHNNLAGVLQKGKRPREAIQHMRMALDIYPDCAWMHVHLGEIYSAQERLYDAQTEFERAIQLVPEFAMAHFNLGVVLSKRGHIATATDHLQRAVQLAPRDPEARKVLAISLAAQGRYDTAIAVLEEGKRLRPKLADRFDELIARFLKKQGPPDRP